MILKPEQKLNMRNQYQGSYTYLFSTGQNRDLFFSFFFSSGGFNKSIEIS
uniref:Uncharacterized protein n=1 Tax=Arundo donax TaxID=35708 RepID=A0A0A9CRN8_ARUDO